MDRSTKIIICGLGVWFIWRVVREFRHQMWEAIAAKIAIFLVASVAAGCVFDREIPFVHRTWPMPTGIAFYLFMAVAMAVLLGWMYLVLANRPTRWLLSHRPVKWPVYATAALIGVRILWGL